MPVLSLWSNMKNKIKCLYRTSEWTSAREVHTEMNFPHAESPVFKLYNIIYFFRGHGPSAISRGPLSLIIGKFEWRTAKAFKKSHHRPAYCSRRDTNKTVKRDRPAHPAYKTSRSRYCPSNIDPRWLAHAYLWVSGTNGERQLFGELRFIAENSYDRVVTCTRRTLHPPLPLSREFSLCQSVNFYRC